MKTLDTLVPDIYALFDPAVMHTPSEENLEAAAQSLKEVLRRGLASREPLTDPLRFSALGKGDRQLWYMAQGTPSEDMIPKTYLKFLYGHVIELMLMFLIKESGHSVEAEQLEVEVDGVKGHIDAIVDGVVIDVKSASPFGYKKFKENDIVGNDPFGYIQQISGYSNLLTPEAGPAFIAFDKVSGDICVTPVSVSVAQDHHPAPRIAHLKEVIANPIPPERCYPDKEEGKSGNRKLGTECSYCPFKHTCWPDLRTFIYSNGPTYLTKVEREPNVRELK